MLEHLSAQLFVEEVMEALEEAPEGLPNMYSRTLDSIDQMPTKHTQMAYNILQWMLFGLRPLTLEELRTAVAIEPGSSLCDSCRISKSWYHSSAKVWLKLTSTVAQSD